MTIPNRTSVGVDSGVAATSAEPVAGQPVVVLMGVSGSGKSTVADLLARRLGWEWQEGDDLHPAANVAKMSAGTPLSDADRAPWLDSVAAWIAERVQRGVSGIITCSALKRSYRDRLRSEGVVFVHLAGTPDEVAKRLGSRTEHFMPSALLTSQFDTLEPPDLTEGALTVDTTGSPAQVVETIVEDLGLRARTAGSVERPNRP